MVKIQNECLAKFGIPKILFADDVFNCKPAKKQAERMKVQLQFCGAHGHRQNGHVERVHRCVNDQVRVLKEQSASMATRNA